MVVAQKEFDYLVKVDDPPPECGVLRAASRTLRWKSGGSRSDETHDRRLDVGTIVPIKVHYKN